MSIISHSDERKRQILAARERIIKDLADLRVAGTVFGRGVQIAGRALSADVRLAYDGSWVVTLRRAGRALPSHPRPDISAVIDYLRASVDEEYQGTEP